MSVIKRIYDLLFQYAYRIGIVITLIGIIAFFLVYAIVIIIQDLIWIICAS